MTIWIYWNNSKKWQGTMLLKVQAALISQADAIFEAITGITPRKVSTIGVSQKYE